LCQKSGISVGAEPKKLSKKLIVYFYQKYFKIRK
jgi:hypothetical protein